MSAATLPASPMVADPYAAPRPMVRRTTLADGTLIATVRNNATRRRMTDRLTDRDRNGIVRAAVMMGTFVGHDHPADNWASWRRATVRNVHTIGTTAHLRPSELAWIDAVGGAAFLAAKLDAAGGEHHG
jgi:hypothetical protein